ncbi:MAG: nickel-dependent lactate racemase [Candidatus Hermodarchaeota archaeon]
MTQTFKIPWAVWKEPGFINLDFPASWDISLYEMEGAKYGELSEVEIKSAILNPIGTLKLSELAKEKTKVVIVIDDMTRPTPIYKILPAVFEELKKANIKEDQITILLAIGAHRPMTRHDCILKLGEEIVNKFRIENHHPYENLEYLGESKKGTPIYVNRTYVEGDLKIAIGGVIPHTLAGFGGGAKIVLPGVCGIDTLEANHKSLSGGIGIITEARKDIEDIAEKVGLDFSINVIYTNKCKIAGIFAGHFKEAHRKAIEFGKQVYSTKIRLNNQICFFNTFPEDSELNQAQYKAFNFLMTAPQKLIDPDGVIVVMTSSYEGRGYHSLVGETGAKLHRNIGETKFWDFFIRGRKVYLFSPNVNEIDKNHFFPKSVMLFNKWTDLVKELQNTFSNSPKVAIIPTSIQLKGKEI